MPPKKVGKKDTKKQMYRASIKLSRLSDVSSFYDTFISNWEYDIEEEKLANFLEELNLIASKYSTTKRLINGEETIEELLKGE